MRETETGEITIMNVKGDNAVIKRKSGEEIKLEPAEKLTLTEFFEKMPKIKDGDTLITGTRSLITVSSTWDSGKTEPNKDYKLENSMSLTLGPDSKARLSTTSWSKIEEDRRMKTHGEGVTKVELIKGIFNASVKNAVKLITPTAVFEKMDAKTTERGGVIEVTNNGTTYLMPNSKLKVKNRSTGKTYLSKSTMFSEIIVTKGAIYRKPMTKMDERMFDLNSAFLTFGGGDVAYESKDSVEMWSDMAADSMDPSKFPKFDESLMKKAMATIEMFSQMKPEDFEKFKELDMTDERLKDMKAGLKEFKQLDKGKLMDEMKKVAKEMKAVQAEREQSLKGVTPEHLEKFKEVTKYRIKGAKDSLKKQKEDAMKTFESLPEYPPLESQFKVA